MNNNTIWKMAGLCSSTLTGVIRKLRYTDYYRLKNITIRKMLSSTLSGLKAVSFSKGKNQRENTNNYDIECRVPHSYVRINSGYKMSDERATSLSYQSSRQIGEGDGSAANNIKRLLELGMGIIAEHNKYTNYTPRQICAVGSGGLIGNYDVRDYDPEEYTAVELYVLVLQDKFKNIGGRGVKVTDYVELVRKYYPDTPDEILRLSIMSMSHYNTISPIIITNEYHPTILQLYTELARAITKTRIIVTDKELIEMRESLDKSVSDLLFEMCKIVSMVQYTDDDRKAKHKKSDHITSIHTTTRPTTPETGVMVENTLSSRSS